MSRKPSKQSVVCGAELIDLSLRDDEVEHVAERLGVLLDASEQITHLQDETAEMDIRFSASWEAYTV